jgi:hypothetical protein
VPVVGRLGVALERGAIESLLEQRLDRKGHRNPLHGVPDATPAQEIDRARAHDADREWLGQELAGLAELIGSGKELDLVGGRLRVALAARDANDGRAKSCCDPPSGRGLFGPGFHAIFNGRSQITSTTS